MRGNFNRCPEAEGERDRRECEVANAELQHQLDIFNACENHTSKKLSSVQEERQILKDDLGGALNAWKHNERVLAVTKKQLEDCRATTTPMIQYLMPTLAGEEAVKEGTNQILEQLLTALDAIWAVERSSARECEIQALSILHLHFPRVVMGRITLGIPRCSTEEDEWAAEEHVAHVVDGVVADLDLGNEE